MWGLHRSLALENSSDPTALLVSQIRFFGGVLILREFLRNLKPDRGFLDF